MDCPLCHLQEYVVARDRDWTVVVNEDQGYLGRCYIALNRHETDITTLTRSERDSLWVWYRRVTASLETLFQPDHYNYVFLMNVTPHLHGHVIPRYAKDRSFRNVTFTDGGLGKHYDLDNVQLLPQAVLGDLAAQIRKELPELNVERAL